MTLLIALTLTLALLGTWALLRDWHRHDWDGRRVLTWTNRHRFYVGMTVQSMGARCRTCGVYSFQPVGPGWTLITWGNR